MDRIESYDRIDIVFEVFIREGSIIKRVVRQNGKTITRLFVFTPFRLIRNNALISIPFQNSPIF